MAFGDYFNNFFGNQGFLENPRDKITITKKEYETLKVKAEKADLFGQEIDKIKPEREKLHKEIEELRDDGRKLKELREQNERYLKSLLRVRADFDNFKKRTERDIQNYRRYATESIMKKVINHYDDLLRAHKIVNSLEGQESVKKGFEMIIKNLEKFFAEEGVEPMNCEGEIFDPYKHEALMVECNDDLPENTIIEEIDKGYYFNNAVLRPSRVKISKKTNFKNLTKNEIKEKGSDI